VIRLSEGIFIENLAKLAQESPNPQRLSCAPSAPSGTGISRKCGLEFHTLNEEMMMSSERRRFGTDQKALILKRYLVDKVRISDLCDEYGIKPNQIYAWQKTLFEHADKAFQASGGRKETSALEDKVVRLESKLQQKNEVIAELMEENVRAKKANGEL
jgi:transposase-like protein